MTCFAGFARFTQSTAKDTAKYALRSDSHRMLSEDLLRRGVSLNEAQINSTGMGGHSVTMTDRSVVSPGHSVLSPGG